ncbi:glycosyltransferase family 2 protein [candidate division WOR-3 bacterium]|nr:glycosyltransferase family 2 protein [candidate division WOR-3 bacterium]
MKLSIVIPVYNEESTIKTLLDKVREVPLEKEIIVVNDGSTDKTGKILEKEKDNIIKVINCEKNGGKGTAVRLGYQYATGDIIVIQDADLELNPMEIPELIHPIIEGNAKVVYGSRFLKRHTKMPFLNLFANKFLVFVTNILYSSSLSDMETCYKVLKKDVLKTIKLTSQRFDFEPEITAKILRKGYKIHELPITYHPRTHGKKIGYKDGIKAVLTLIKYRLY